MRSFDGAKYFAQLVVVYLMSALIASPYVGCSGWVAALVALYVLLGFFNALERRDLSTGKPKRRRKARAP